MLHELAEKRCIQMLVGTHEGKRPLARHRSRWKIILNKIFKI
jgi:hypothetical protein